jgi:hypothetical protein
LCKVTGGPDIDLMPSAELARFSSMTATASSAPTKAASSTVTAKARQLTSTEPGGSSPLGEDIEDREDRDPVESLEWSPSLPEDGGAADSSGGAVVASETG